MTNWSSFFSDHVNFMIDVPIEKWVCQTIIRKSAREIIFGIEISKHLLQTHQVQTSSGEHRPVTHFQTSPSLLILFCPPFLEKRRGRSWFHLLLVKSISVWSNPYRSNHFWTYLSILIHINYKSTWLLVNSPLLVVNHLFLWDSDPFLWRQAKRQRSHPWEGGPTNFTTGDATGDGGFLRNPALIGWLKPCKVVPPPVINGL